MYFRKRRSIHIARNAATSRRWLPALIVLLVVTSMFGPVLVIAEDAPITASDVPALDSAPQDTTLDAQPDPVIADDGKRIHGSAEAPSAGRLLFHRNRVPP